MGIPKDSHTTKASPIVEYLEDEIHKTYHHNSDARIRNPLSGLTESELDAQAATFCTRYGFTDDLSLFQKAARVAQAPEAYEELTCLTDDDKYYLRREIIRESQSSFHLQTDADGMEIKTNGTCRSRCTCALQLHRLDPPSSKREGMS